MRLLYDNLRPKWSLAYKGVTLILTYIFKVIWPRFNDNKYC